MAGDREGTEKRLKAAAIEVWARHGFHGAPVSLIAECARANVALINRYFGSKEGLFQALVRDMIMEKQQGELDYPPQATLSDETLAYLRFRYAEDMRHRALLRIIISELTTNDAFRQQALKTLEYAGDLNFRARLERLQRAGRIRSATDLALLFRQISLFSFACGFIEGIVLELPAQSTNAAMSDFATAIGTAHAA